MLKQSIQEEEYGGRTSDNNITNVVKLHLLCGGNLYPEGNEYGQSTQANVHRAFYYPGIGAYGNILQQVVNMAFAPRNMDVAMVINKAKEDFINSLPSDLSDLKVDHHRVFQRRCACQTFCYDFASIF